MRKPAYLAVDIETTGLNSDQRSFEQFGIPDWYNKDADLMLEIAVAVIADDFSVIDGINILTLPHDNHDPQQILTIDDIIATCNPHVRKMHTSDGLFTDLRRGHDAYTAAKHEPGDPEPLDGHLLVDTTHCAEGRIIEMLDGLNESINTENFIEFKRLERSGSSVAPDLIDRITTLPMLGSSCGSLDRPMIKRDMPELYKWFSHRDANPSSDIERLTRSCGVTDAQIDAFYERVIIPEAEAAYHDLLGVDAAAGKQHRAMYDLLVSVSAYHHLPEMY